MSRLSHHHPTAAQDRDRSESGVILITVAVSLLALLLMGAFVASGSQAYSQRRNAQNAADAAAMAGARALNAVLFENASAGTLSGAVANSVDDNRGFEHDCYLVLHDGARMQDPDTDADIECDDTAVLNYWNDYLADEAPTWDQPVGVEVVAADRKPTLFGGVEGLSETVTARASAIATIQAINQIGSPFALCGHSIRQSTGNRQGFDLLRRHSDTPLPPYNSDPGTDFVFNPDGTVDIHEGKAEQLGVFNLAWNRASGCGIEDSSYGGIIAPQTFTIPGWTDVTTGNGVEHAVVTQVLSARACPTPLPEGPLDCDMVIPLAIDGREGPRQMNVVAAGVFRVTTGSGNIRFVAEYVGEVTQVTGGYSSDAPPGATSLRVIRLIK